jgi:hypothetical protein
MWQSGLAANSAADGSSRCNNSINCFARTQIYRLNTHRPDCCQLSRVQSLPVDVGPGDSRLFAPGGIQFIGNQ